MFPEQLLEADLFLSRGQEGGWAALLAHIQESATAKEGAGHAKLAQVILDDILIVFTIIVSRSDPVVLGVIKLIRLRQRDDLRKHTAALDAAVNSDADDLQKLRYAELSRHITTSYIQNRSQYDEAHANLMRAFSTYPSNPSAADPLIHAATVEKLAATNVSKSNSLITLSLEWQAKTKELEEIIFDKIKECLRIWEAAKSVLVSLRNCERCTDYT